jgi:fumarate hydratase class II
VGKQTDLSLRFFSFREGIDRIPAPLIRAIVLIKAVAAETNHRLGGLSAEKTRAILDACEAVLEGGFEEQFPLFVWQTGSGTQSNMNVNEVIASLASRRSVAPASIPTTTST